VKALGACHTLHATEEYVSRHVSHGTEEHITRHASPIVAVDHTIRVEHWHDFEHEIVPAPICDAAAATATRARADTQPLNPPPPEYLSIQAGPHQIIDNPLHHPARVRLAGVHARRDDHALAQLQLMCHVQHLNNHVSHHKNHTAHHNRTSHFTCSCCASEVNDVMVSMGQELPVRVWHSGLHLTRELLLGSDSILEQ